MKKELQKKLKAYSLAATAITAFGATANAQVVYTDIDPDVTISVEPDSLIIDMNNDGTWDFKILKTTAASSTNGIRMNANTGNEILGVNTYATYFVASALNAGAPINNAAGAWNGTMNGGMITLAWGTSYGYWQGVTDKYLGLRFQVSGNTHYGWARLDVAAGGTSAIIKDFAYQATPDSTILAGDTVTIGVSEIASNNAAIKLRNNELSINAKANYDVLVIDLTGRIVYEGIINKGSNRISLLTQPSGVYIVRLINEFESIEQKIIR